MPSEFTSRPAFLPVAEPKQGFTTFNDLEVGEWFVALIGPLQGQLCRKHEWGYHPVRIFKGGKLENRGGGVSEGDKNFPVVRANPAYCDWE